MLRARVINGRLIMDEPTDVPEGTVLDLVVDDEGDELDEHERALLDEHLARSWASARQGCVRLAGRIVEETQKETPWRP
jgi:hypothetical protein